MLMVISKSMVIFYLESQPTENSPCVCVCVHVRVRACVLLGIKQSLMHIR